MIRPAAIGSRDRTREPRRPVTVHNAEMHACRITSRTGPAGPERRRGPPSCSASWPRRLPARPTRHRSRRPQRHDAVPGGRRGARLHGHVHAHHRRPERDAASTSRPTASPRAGRRGSAAAASRSTASYVTPNNVARRHPRRRDPGRHADGVTTRSRSSATGGGLHRHPAALDPGRGRRRGRRHADHATSPELRGAADTTLHVQPRRPQRHRRGDRRSRWTRPGPAELDRRRPSRPARRRRRP